MIINKEESKPINLGLIDINTDEMMFYMYLPILMKGKGYYFHLPERLKFIKPLLGMMDSDEIKNKYVYVTVKNTYVSPESMSQRMGWHIDGYGTNDINYIWYSECPTEFAIGDFTLSDSDSESLLEMQDQVSNAEILTYPNKSLLKLNAKEVHRVNENHNYEGMRLFIKISVSDHKYNLKGNSKNYLINYDWPMYSRNELRNMENNKDFA